MEQENDNIKKSYVFVDEDGDIEECFSDKIVIDQLFEFKRYRERLTGPLKLHYAAITIKEEVKG